MSRQESYTYENVYLRKGKFEADKLLLEAHFKMIRLKEKGSENFMAVRLKPALRQTIESELVAKMQETMARTTTSCFFMRAKKFNLR